MNTETGFPSPPRIAVPPFRSSRVRSCLQQALQQKAFAGAVLLAGNSRQILVWEAIGLAHQSSKAPPVRPDTIFDLASLTKPLATALAVMMLVQDGVLEWEMPLERALPLGGPAPLLRSDLTLTHLLSHSSGLPCFRPYYFWLKNRPREDPRGWIRQSILHESLRWEPGARSSYSDLGYILLDWIVEIASGRSLPDFVKQRIYDPLGLERTGFLSARPHSFHPHDFASTGLCRWRKRNLVGEVHDRNAYVMGGYSGHAGLFSTASNIWRLLASLYRAYQGRDNRLFHQHQVRRLWTRQTSPMGTTWALGFDTPSGRDSSAGTLFSSQSVGHLGYTGVSFWLDLDRDTIVILFTNRTVPRPRNTRLRSLRPGIHQMAYETALEIQRNQPHGSEK